jgi:hypothetical protein
MRCVENQLINLQSQQLPRLLYLCVWITANLDFPKPLNELMSLCKFPEILHFRLSSLISLQDNIRVWCTARYSEANCPLARQLIRTFTRMLIMVTMSYLISARLWSWLVYDKGHRESKNIIKSSKQYFSSFHCGFAYILNQKPWHTCKNVILFFRRESRQMDKSFRLDDKQRCEGEYFCRLCLHQNVRWRYEVEHYFCVSFPLYFYFVQFHPAVYVYLIVYYLMSVLHS